MTNQPKLKRLGGRAACLLLGGLLLIPGVVGAQEIGGTVTDTTGGVLPGVTVEARSAVLIEGVRAAVTDGNGQYLVIALEPGTYDVTYTLPGFSTLVREGVEISIGFAANINVQLSVGDIQETITVSGATPVVDIQNVEQRQVMDREVIDSIPTGKSFQSYAMLVPGMTASESYLTPLSTDSGGMAPATLQRMQIHGSTENDQQLDINGMDVGDSLLQGSNYSIFPDSNFEELSIEFSSQTAEIETGGVRINMIPREGANQFGGHVFTTFTFPELNADNVGQDLISRGLSKGNFVDEVWTINPVFGGPIVQDKLWFFVAHTSGVGDLLPADVYHATDIYNLRYIEDEDNRFVDRTTIREQSMNLTWQASSKDKIKAYWTNSSTDKPNLLTGRTLSSIFVAPSAAIRGVIRTNTYQATWTRPQTNRLLFEAGFSHLPVRYQLNPTETSDTTIPGVLEVSPVQAHRNMSGWFSGATQRNSPKHTNFLRASMSFVTGSHNLKVGLTSLHLGENTINSADNDWTGLMTYGGFPIYANFRTPGIGFNRSNSMGLYVQEQWTLNRLTVNAGLRYESFRSGFPDQISPASTWSPQDYFIEGVLATGWHDLQPRVGIAYDVAGDGRTAIKFSASRYGARDSTDYAVGLNPGQTNTLNRRSWNDGYTGCVSGTCIVGDGIPQGDPLNPAANGELRTPMLNPAFGVPVVNTFYDESWSRGWFNRGGNWEYTASIQRELIAGMSVDIGFFRRNIYGFSVSDDRVLGPDDFDEFQVMIPNDPRLETAGNMITLRDQKPGSIATPDRITSGSSTFGGESRNWQGFDINLDARLNRILFAGGISTGRTATNNCALTDALPENEAVSVNGNPIPLDYCDATHNWLTQVKFLTSYSLPYGIELAATLQNQSGPVRQARVTYSAAAIASALGRPSTAGAQTINVLEPGSVYGERFSQLDFRVTKIFEFGGGTRLRAMFDLFNLLNANGVTREQPGFGSAYLMPQVIMPGRLGKFAFQIDF